MTLLSLLAIAALPLVASSTTLRAPGVAGVSHADLFPREAHSRTRAAHRRLMSSWRAAAPVSAPARSLSPAALGADPTCTTDSSAVFSTLTQLLVASAVGEMSDGIKDLGGMTVDLGGGCFLLSQPWVLPQFIGNMHVTYGELRASSAFPVGGTLVQVGAQQCKTPSGQGSW